MNSGQNKKRGSGCSCITIGCVALLALLLLPVAAGFVALSLVNDSFYGEKIMLIIKQPAFVDGAREALDKSDKLSARKKKLLINFYDQLISEYDRLPAEKQKVIHKNIVVVLRQALFNSDSFEKNPPPELKEMIQMLGYPELDPDMLKKEMQEIQDQTAVPKPPQPPAQQPPKPSYDF